ncbi:MAG TPA: dihydroxyacetone kinase subunit DhaK [Ruminococcaceae bacterium]|nr:dihydroxyacetone kinase subunit DhaK [Oscillospiraceae bacterium]
MKKIINDVSVVEEEMISGLVKANPDVLSKIEDELIVIRKNPKKDKVAIVTGGGSGHEPAHAGYVGYGMLDAAVAGAVYTSPSVDAIATGIRAVDSGKGTLLIIKNYTGDIINFEMAAEEVEEDDNIMTRKVIVTDDVAVENSTWTAGRRGVAGTVFVHKIAGAKAESGADLDEVAATAQRVVDNVRTMGMAINPSTIPAAGIPGFTLGEDEMEVGIGIHGEPGVRKQKLTSANEIADILLEKILADLDYNHSEVAVMVNGCGGTPLMELYIVYNHLADVLKEKGIRIYKSFVGNYMTSLEMEGFSISLLKLDDEMKQLLDEKAETPAFKM